MKVAIIGTVPISKRVAPYGDPSWQIWCCSPGNTQAGAPPRIDTWFELHSLVDMRGQENAAWMPGYIAWLNAQQFPVYMQERNDEVPRAVPFPREELMKRFGPHHRGDINWFTSSIAWMIAFAIVRGAKEIGIFGVDMAATEEHYSWQKAGCQRFIEFAKDAGITVTIPLESTLGTPAPLYGYAESSRMGRSLIAREFEMKEKVQQLQNMQRQAELEIAFFRGAVEECQFSRRTFVSGFGDAEIDIEVPVDVTALAEVSKATAEDLMQHPAEFEPASPESKLLVPAAKRKKRDPMKPPSADDFPNSPAAALLGKHSNGAKRETA